MITVLTATYNAEKTLPDLIKSLQQQTDPDFKWIVIDGLSTDGTVSLAEEIKNLDITVVSERDFGIYDALNKGVERVETEYYLVAGADDTFESNAIALYKKGAESGADIVTAPVNCGAGQRVPKGRYTWTDGIWGMISNHSVGCIIRRSLHEKYGMYSRQYPIAADMDFLIKAFRGGAVVKSIPDTVGRFSDQGVSTRKYLQSIFESTIAGIENGHRLAPELFRMTLRIAKHYLGIRRSYSNYSSHQK